MFDNMEDFVIWTKDAMLQRSLKFFGVHKNIMLGFNEATLESILMSRLRPAGLETRTLESQI